MQHSQLQAAQGLQRFTNDQKYIYKTEKETVCKR